MNEIQGLVARWQRGDERAAEALYNRFRLSTFRLAYGLLGDAADAEEAANDALTYALTRIHRYDPERASFATWLHTITVSRCRDRRRRRRLPSFSLSRWQAEGGDAPDPSPSPEHLVARAESRSYIWDAVQALSPPLREAIILRHWTGSTYEAMASILDCPVGTAQSRVRLAYQRLRAVLNASDIIAFQEEESA